ncbi:hypothetical protein OAJ65_03710, partial [Flavobacteriales bacterium]|nr:hypothetical protein [Flavobacteriales bacterium]
KNWPAHGNFNNPTVGFRNLAPFYSPTGNIDYDPASGDYPDYNITGTNDNAGLFGDQTLWWVFNDKGNIHTETEAEPLGLEIHAQAFGFAADNEVNDMTFYNYKIINRSTTPLNDTYFGQWVDPDLGYYLDDYVGCDVKLGLGFCYNGDAEDEGAAGYGFNPPAIGVDFFQGPLADPNDGINNDNDFDSLGVPLIDEGTNGIDDDGDGEIDELDEQEQIIMSKFVYYNNDFTVIGNPENGTHIYNYLRGIWKDNVPMTFGGDGHGGGIGSTTTECNFMFPGTSDEQFPGQEWTEQTANNIPADRRFVQSAGAFTLQPGAVNTITVGVVWARAKAGGQTASINLVKVYDREAQALFDNNFNILNGPDAPDLEIQELDKQLVFTLSNSGISNNINESYSEKDPYITNSANLQNSPNYEFQGYLVYQLANSTVSVTDLADPDLARLIYRSDINDGVTGIVNHYLDPLLLVYTPIEEVPSVLNSGVVGSVDEGIQFSFQVTDDRFAISNTRLVNHKTYYYMAIAYGYNGAEINTNPYDADAPDYDGRNQPHISGRRNIQTYSGIPHFTEVEAGGTTLQSSYGDGVKITRVEGQGNGGNNLELTSETVDEILASDDHRSLHPIYKQGKGPIEITVVDPLKIPKGDYALKLEDPIFTGTAITSYGKWTLVDDASGAIVASASQDIVLGSEKYITILGLNIKVKQALNPGADPQNTDKNGLISGTIEFENQNDRWLSGLADMDDDWGQAEWGYNWIRAGSDYNAGIPQMSDHGVTENSNNSDDPNGVYEGAVIQTNTVNSIFGTYENTGGTWAPYSLASYFNDGPGLSSSVTNQNKIENINSVDIVFTNDNSKWSKVCVVEAQDDPTLAIGTQVKMGLRQSPSLNINGGLANDGTMGMSYFPGYAIDVETGERLNIIFSEDSWSTSENGNDMIWNPTSRLTTEDPPFYNPSAPPGEQFFNGNFLLGGKHFIYIVKGESWVKGTEDYINDIANCNNSPNYDESAWIYNKLLNDGTGVGKWNVFKNVSWVGIPLLAPGRSLLTNTATVKLRVTKPYKQYETVDNDKILNNNMTLTIGNTYVVAYLNANTTWGGQTVTHDGTTYSPGDKFVATTTSFSSASAKARAIDHDALNAFNPIYRFNTDDILANSGNLEVAKDAMELIKVVPNPYYG